MGLLSNIVLLPLAPVRGVVKLAELIQQQAEEQLYSPANTRRQLEELEERRMRGEISAEEEQRGQEQILESRMTPNADKGTTPDSG